LHHIKHFLELFGTPHDIFELIPHADLTAQTLVLVFQPRIFEGLVDEHGHIIEFKRLGKVMKGPSLNGLHSTIDGAKTGHDQCHGLRIDFFEFRDEFNPRHVGHLQIGDDQIVNLVLGQLHSLCAVRSTVHIVFLGCQKFGQRFLDGRLIINYQNFFFHKFLLTCAFALSPRSGIGHKSNRDRRSQPHITFDIDFPFVSLNDLVTYG